MTGFLSKLFHWIKATFFRSNDHLATKRDLDLMEGRIMSSIKDFSDAVNAKFDEMGLAVDGLTNSLAGVSADITYLKGVIDQLQNNPGPISPEDQALLDEAVAKVNALSTNLSSVNTALAALDAATEEPPIP